MSGSDRLSRITRSSSVSAPLTDELDLLAAALAQVADRARQPAGDRRERERPHPDRGVLELVEHALARRRAGRRRPAQLRLVTAGRVPGGGGAARISPTRSSRWSIFSAGTRRDRPACPWPAARPGLRPAGARPRRGPDPPPGWPVSPERLRPRRRAAPLARPEIGEDVVDGIPGAGDCSAQRVGGAQQRRGELRREASPRRAPGPARPRRRAPARASSSKPSMPAAPLIVCASRKSESTASASRVAGLDLEQQVRPSRSSRCARLVAEELDELGVELGHRPRPVRARRRPGSRR